MTHNHNEKTEGYYSTSTTNLESKNGGLNNYVWD